MVWKANGKGREAPLGRKCRVTFLTNYIPKVPRTEDLGSQIPNENSIQVSWASDLCIGSRKHFMCFPHQMAEEASQLILNMCV